tara:strand:+ start:10060 stop:11010 length:951 start_codon:yes stop_codon:yes gene_type:complete
MASINNIEVLRRHQRPSESSKLLLDFYLIKDGAYADPYQVCSVHIFPNTTNGDADGFLDLTPGSSQYGLVSATAPSLFEYRNVGSDSVLVVDPTNAKFNESNYGGGVNDSSGIHKLGTGHFATVLTPGAFYADYDTALGNVSGNGASGSGKFMDIWTIVDSVGSTARTYINQFQLHSDGTFAVTEKITVTPSTKLQQKYVQLGTQANLVVKTDFSYDSPNMTGDVENLLQGALIGSASASIVKINDDLRGAAVTHITGTAVDSFTTVDVEVLSDDTILYFFDTTKVAVTAGNYELRVKYTVLGETFVSPPMNLVIQ